MLSLAASHHGTPPSAKDFERLKQSSPLLDKYTVERFRVNFFLKLIGDDNAASSALRGALDVLLTYLKENGYANCCEHCGRTEDVFTYGMYGSANLLCAPCFEIVGEEAWKAYNSNYERVFPGVIGAIIGSLLGADLIFLSSSLGYVSSVFGLLLSICTLEGYKVRGRKLGKDGTITSCVLIAVMAFIGYHARWVDSYMGYSSGNVFENFSTTLAYVLESPFVGAYCGGLFLICLFAAVGAVLLILKEKNKDIKPNFFRKMDESS